MEIINILYIPNIVLAEKSVLLELGEQKIPFIVMIAYNSVMAAFGADLREYHCITDALGIDVSVITAI